MSDISVIYHSANMEDPVFEKKIQDKIIENSGGIPIISVSQQPMDFGENICIGEVGASNFNMFRQVQIALQTAKTPFVAVTEADCLHPPCYFKFKPPVLDECYRNTNIYILHRHNGFCPKRCSGFSQIVGREYWLDILNKIFEGKPQWDETSKKWPGEPFETGWSFFATEDPCISIKTGRGLRPYTQLSSKEIFDEVPYWGSADKLRDELRFANEENV